MSPAENDEGIRTTPAPPAPVPAPDPAEASPGNPASPSPFGSLRAFPSNPFQTSELPPPKSAIAELVAGAILGVLPGLVCFGPAGLLVGPLVGALDGYWVGHLVGRAGKLTVWSLLVNLFRIPFVNVATIL